MLRQFQKKIAEQEQKFNTEEGFTPPQSPNRVLRTPEFQRPNPSLRPLSSPNPRVDSPGFVTRKISESIVESPTRRITYSYDLMTASPMTIIAQRDIPLADIPRIPVVRSGLCDLADDEMLKVEIEKLVRAYHGS